jgi:hypothetical protein
MSWHTPPWNEARARLGKRRGTTVAHERPIDELSDNRHWQRWTPTDTHGQYAPGWACNGAGSPPRYLASGRRGQRSGSRSSSQRNPRLSAYAAHMPRCVAEFSRIRSRRLRCAPPRPGAAPGSASGGPPGARRARTRSRSPDQSAHFPRIKHHCRIAAARPAANGTGHAWTDTGTSSASDCVALQGRPAKGSFAVASDGASATLDSPAPPGGFRQLSDEAPPRLS